MGTSTRSTCSTTTSSACAAKPTGTGATSSRVRRASPSTVPERRWADRAARPPRSSCARTSMRPMGIPTRPWARSRSDGALGVPLREQQRVRGAPGACRPGGWKREPELHLLRGLLGRRRHRAGARRPGPVPGSVDRDRLARERDDGLHPDGHPVRPDQRRVRNHLAGGRRPVRPGRPDRLCGPRKCRSARARTRSPRSPPTEPARPRRCSSRSPTTRRPRTARRTAAPVARCKVPKTKGMKLASRREGDPQGALQGRQGQVGQVPQAAPWPGDEHDPARRPRAQLRQQNRAVRVERSLTGQFRGR